MSKTKSSKIPHYELLCLISNKFAEDELKPIIEKIREAIKAKGGSIKLLEEWGKKRLAYPVKQFSYGYYILAEFDLEEGGVAEINRAFRMMSELLRFQIVSKKVKTKEEVEKEKKIIKIIADRAAKKKKAEEEAKEEKISVSSSKSDSKTKPVKDEKKIDFGDLDEKLDKILETDDLL